MIDGRELDSSLLDQRQIQKLCHRRFGIGADGLIVLNESKDHDFAMRYFNSDGREGSMCGNGGRCIAAFARHLGITGNEMSFEGIDGIHFASFLSNGNIRLKLKDVTGIQILEDAYLLDTGSPHFVKVCEEPGPDQDGCCWKGDQAPIKVRKRRSKCKLCRGRYA